MPLAILYERYKTNSMQDTQGRKEAGFNRRAFEPGPTIFGGYTPPPEGTDSVPR